MFTKIHVCLSVEKKTINTISEKNPQCFECQALYYDMKLTCYKCKPAARFVDESNRCVAQYIIGCDEAEIAEIIHEGFAAQAGLGALQCKPASWCPEPETPTGKVNSFY